MDDIRELTSYNKARWSKVQTQQIQAAVGAEPDGVWGPQTISKVMIWQKSNKLVADGKVGPATYAKILSVTSSPKDKIVIQFSDDALAQIMGPTIQTEAGYTGNPYTASNLDAEFKGWFDHPRRHPVTNERLNPAERAAVRRDRTLNPSDGKGGYKYTAFWASMYANDGMIRSDSDPGTHIGRSEGMIQFAQSPGSLGAYNEAAQKLNPDEFARIMGPCWRELVKVTTAPSGKPKLVKSLSNGLRNGKVHPVDGHDLWEGPWNERYDELGDTEFGKQAQRLGAKDGYLLPALSICRGYGWSSEVEISVVFDMCVQFGPGSDSRGARKYLKQAKAKYGEDAGIIQCLNILSSGHRDRRLKVASLARANVFYEWQ